MFLLSSCTCLCAIYWSQVLSRKWRCSWSSADIEIPRVCPHGWFTSFQQQTCVHVRAWWRHQMETFSTLLILCEGKPPVTGGLPSQRPVTRSFDVFFDLLIGPATDLCPYGTDPLLEPMFAYHGWCHVPFVSEERISQRNIQENHTFAASSISPWNYCVNSEFWRRVYD